LEIKLFNRDVLSLVLVLFFPILMMSLFGTVFGDEPVFGAGPDGQGGITPAHYYLPGMLALSTILSGFQNLSSYVATERFNGTVKRLAGTPLPAASYFIGKTGQTLYLIVAQTVLLLLAAAVLFDVPLPRDAGQWGLVALLMILATAAWATVAIAFTALPKSAQSASTLAVLPVLLLSFTSGVYFPFSQLPDWLQSVTNFFPLRWTASAFRSVFLPAGFEAVEPGGTYNLPLTFLVLGFWVVAGAVLARLAFKWPPEK
jgi:ABC-2 type transport system permease protein